jgi:hypothetical protein
MDEAKTRAHVQDHADAVARGDMQAVTDDFIEELRPQVPEIAKLLPLPVTSAEVLSVEIGDDESVARIRYAGDSGQVTIQTQWREVDGRPSIFAGEPVD